MPGSAWDPFEVHIKGTQEDQMTTFLNFATKSPLVCDVNGSNRHVFCMRPPLQGHFLAASISVNSVD